MSMDGEKMLEILRKRTAGTRWGIGTAGQYLKSIEDCFDGGACPVSVFDKATPEQWALALKEAESRLTYCNEDMEVKEASIRTSGLMVPNALIEFDHVITSTKTDRDGDVIECDGVKLDAKMPLLWQHMPMQPLGPFVGVTKHTSDIVYGKSAILDTTFGRDAAVLVQGGALRISHGFKAYEAEPIIRTDKDTAVVTGFRVKQSEIMEVSLVSIPSNTDAVILAYSTNKLTHPLVKGWARKQYEARPVIVPGHSFDKAKDGCACGGGKDAAHAGTQIKERTVAEKTAAVTDTKGDVVTGADTSNLNPQPPAPAKNTYKCPACATSIDLTGVPDGMDLREPTCPMCGEKMKNAGAPRRKDGRMLSASTASRLAAAHNQIGGILNDAGIDPADYKDDDEDDDEVEGNDDEGEGRAAQDGQTRGKKKSFILADKKEVSGRDLNGSFEWIMDALWGSASVYLKARGYSVPGCYLLATFANSGIVCVRNYDSNNDTYYRIPWEMIGGKPMWNGDPKEVKIEQNITEKSVHGLNAQFGRVAGSVPAADLSKAICAKSLTLPAATAIEQLQAARSDITETLGLLLDQQDAQEFDLSSLEF